MATAASNDLERFYGFSYLIADAIENLWTAFALSFPLHEAMMIVAGALIVSFAIGTASVTALGRLAGFYVSPWRVIATFFLAGLLMMPIKVSVAPSPALTTVTKDFESDLLPWSPATTGRISFGAYFAHTVGANVIAIIRGVFDELFRDALAGTDAEQSVSVSMFLPFNLTFADTLKHEEIKRPYVVYLYYCTDATKKDPSVPLIGWHAVGLLGGGGLGRFNDLMARYYAKKPTEKGKLVAARASATAVLDRTPIIGEGVPVPAGGFRVLRREYWKKFFENPSDGPPMPVLGPGGSFLENTVVGTRWDDVHPSSPPPHDAEYRYYVTTCGDLLRVLDVAFKEYYDALEELYRIPMDRGTDIGILGGGSYADQLDKLQDVAMTLALAWVLTRLDQSDLDFPAIRRSGPTEGWATEKAINSLGEVGSVIMQALLAVYKIDFGLWVTAALAAWLFAYTGVMAVFPLFCAFSVFGMRGNSLLLWFKVYIFLVLTLLLLYGGVKYGTSLLWSAWQTMAASSIGGTPMAIRLAPLVLMGPFAILAIAMASPALAGYLVFGTGGGGVASGSFLRAGATLGGAFFVAKGAARFGFNIAKRTPAGRAMGVAAPAAKKAMVAARSALSRLRR